MPNQQAERDIKGSKQSGDKRPSPKRKEPVSLCVLRSTGRIQDPHRITNLMLRRIAGCVGMNSVLHSARVAEDKNRSIHFSMLSLSLHHLYDSATSSRCRVNELPRDEERGQCDESANAAASDHRSGDVSTRWKFEVAHGVRSGLDFMAALRVSAAFFERKSGGLAGVAKRGLRGINRAEPQTREHRRSGVTQERANT